MLFTQEWPVDDALVDEVRREWPLDDAEPDADVQAWRRGAELYEDDDRYDATMRAGDLMARAVRYHLHGADVLRDDDLAVSVQSLLFAATTPAPDGAPATPQARRLARLALAVITLQGWQPAHLGGDGQVPAGLFADDDMRRELVAAVAPI